MPKHLFPQNTSRSEPFEKPPSGGGEAHFPERDRQEHGETILNQLSRLQEKIAEHQDQLPVPNAIYLDFEGEANCSLAVQSIESVRDKRELVAVKTLSKDEGEVISATVLVDPEKLPKLTEKIEKYLTEHLPNKPDEPKNRELVESISNIKFSSLRSILVDNLPLENEDEVIRWEAWLRVGETNEDRARIVEDFRRIARERNLIIGNSEIHFPENTVILLVASFRQIENSIFRYKLLAELRRAAETTDFFLRLNKRDEFDLVNDARERIIPPNPDVPAVCLLDTGVNYEHPLIQIALQPQFMDAYNRNWLITDHHSHGTAMAGLSLYGDLIDLLLSVENHRLRHCLESVKILPPVGENPLELYGEITKECVSRAEIFAPFRERVICLAVTSTIFRDKGVPSSWSASIDALASASFEEEGNPRLFFISAGNTNQNFFSNYPDSNYTDEIHDPAQAWNAITVGGYTEKVSINPNSEFGDSEPLAPYGCLCPHSTTSLEWKDEWSNKPDIVMEAGNLAVHPSYGSPFEHPSLRLLTTYYRWQDDLLIDFGATSAATAQAARMGAIILAEYPNLWAETVRGLIVHSANWTAEMLAEAGNNKRQLLRCYGYGVANLNRALQSANNSLTLIIQDQLQPFVKEENYIKLNEMNLHEIPWARDILLDLGERQAEMRVTLSYFIEPNPSSKGYKTKHRYASHQLKFTTIKSQEGRDEFRKRINKSSRQAGENIDDKTGDSAGWFLGEKLRSKGSIHSDIWRGNAADLATKNFIAVYPVGGWWKELKRQEKWDSVARYSLIVTIKTEETDVDIYSVVQNEIENIIEI